MTMADTVVVMSGGEIRQAASPIEIYRRPADSFVADFIGQTNLIEAESDARNHVTVLGQPVPGLQLPPGAAKATISIRPEDVHLTAPGAGALTGTVNFVRDLGGTIETFVDVAGRQIVAVSTPRARPEVRVGQEVGVALTPDVCVVLRK
jgi:putative spermidine/putrescine transport system ATP-binding protein